MHAHRAQTSNLNWTLTHGQECAAWRAELDLQGLSLAVVRLLQPTYVRVRVVLRARAVTPPTCGIHIKTHNWGGGATCRKTSSVTISLCLL